MGNRQGRPGGWGRPCRVCGFGWLLLVGDGFEDVQLGGATGGENRGQETGDDAEDHEADDLRHRDGQNVDALRRQCCRNNDTEEETNDDTEKSPDHRNDDRLPPDHASDLTPMHTNGPQQADLPGPLEDREGQCVGDSEHGNDHRKDEQGVEHHQQLVDLVFLRLPVLGLITNLNVRVIDGSCLDDCEPDVRPYVAGSSHLDVAQDVHDHHMSTDAVVFDIDDEEDYEELLRRLGLPLPSEETPVTTDLT